MLRFPHIDVLRLALSRQALSPALTGAPVNAGFDQHERVWLQPSAELSRNDRSELRLVGAELDPAGEIPLSEHLCCWHQLLELCPAAPESLAAHTPFLFQLDEPALWPALVGEIRRLGHGRDWGWRETEDGRVLVRVVGPPYYSLLRALEPENPSAKLQAFVEQAPRVWVEQRWRQPLAEQIRPPPGRMLLIRRPRHWSFLDDEPFQQEVRHFPLAHAPMAWLEGATDCRLKVPLRMAAVRTHEPASLWVLRDRPLEQLSRLLRDADDVLLAGLEIAISQSDGATVVVLRAKSGRTAVPVLVLDAEDYHLYLKLPNLYVPCGRRLQPSLRRDRVRELLGGSGGRITWLTPRPDGSFVVQSVAEAAFAPLLERVDYWHEHPQEPLAPWRQTNAFAFEPFASRGDDLPEDWRGHLRTPPTPAPEPNPIPQTAPPVIQPGGWLRTVLARLPRWLHGGAEALAENTAETLPPAAASVAPSSPQAQRDILADAVQAFLQPAAGLKARQQAPAQASANRGIEQRFLSMEGPLDAPERQALWPKLAGLYQAEENWLDAAVCWMNALWEAQTPSPLSLWGWFRSEARAASWQEPKAGLEWSLGVPRPEAAAVRAVAAYTRWGAEQETPPAGLFSQLPAIRQYLEANEHLLPVRAAWLAWSSVSRLTGGDTLTLARARDRLLERLFRKGLSLDQDLPGFLRFATQEGGGRSEPIREWLVRQRGAIHHWIEALHQRQSPDPAQQDRNILATERLYGKEPPFGPAGEAYCTKVYADLALAWGLARLGAESECWPLWKQARAVLSTRDAVHQFLLDAYSYRIQQILDGRSPEGPLPEALLARLQEMPEQDRYKIDRLREQSRILEPLETIDPYGEHVQRGYFDDLNPILARLSEASDRGELKQRIDQLLDEAPKKGNVRAALPRTLKAALEQAPRIDETFACDLLRRAAVVIEELPSTADLAPLLERALFVAAHFQQTDYVKPFLARFHELFERPSDPAATRTVASLAAQACRSLRKLGMRQEIDRLLKRMAQCILQGRDIASLRKRLGPKRVRVLPALLHVAGVWFHEGNEGQATAVLDDAWLLLSSGLLAPAHQANLARAYAASLGQAPARLALERIEELFRKLGKVNDSLTTKSHFSLAQLGTVEAVVAAVVDANFTLNTTVRRWLDEDEYLVRRRIHRDLRDMIGEKQGTTE